MLNDLLSHFVSSIPLQPSKPHSRKTMSSTVVKLTTYAQNASRRPILDEKESKKALEDTSWADVCSIFWLCDEVWLTLLLGPPRNCGHLRFQQSHGPRVCSIYCQTCRWPTRGIPFNAKAFFSTGGARPCVGCFIFHTHGLRQCLETGETGKSRGNRIRVEKPGCQLLQTIVQTLPSSNYSDNLELVRLPTGCIWNSEEVRRLLVVYDQSDAQLFLGYGGGGFAICHSTNVVILSRQPLRSTTMGSDIPFPRLDVCIHRSAGDDQPEALFPSSRVCPRLLLVVQLEHQDWRSYVQSALSAESD